MTDMSIDSRIRPGRRWYLLAVAALVLGAAWAVTGLLLINSAVDSFPRVPEPGSATLILPRGGYIVYYEGRGASAGTVPAGNIDVRPLSATGAVGRIAAYPASSSMTYAFGGREGSAVATVQIDQPGRFAVRATAPDGAPAGADLAFGPSIAGWIVAAVAPAALLAVAGIGGGITVAVIRHRRIRRAAAAPAPPSPQAAGQS